MAKKSLRDLSRERHISSLELAGVFLELEHSSDRGAAVLASAQVQDALSSLVLMHFETTSRDVVETLYDRNGPLSSFFSVIHLAWAMGLVDKEMVGYLNFVRRIRNTFAHAIRPISFFTPEINRECALLQSSRRLRALRKKHLVNPNPDNPARNTYIQTCLGLATHFIKRAGKRLARNINVRGRKLERLRAKKKLLEKLSR